MNTPSYQLFVYGSLRSGFHNPAYEYLTKYFHFIGEAIVKGRLYDNGSYPVAAPVTEDHYINGELYELNNPNEFDWAIEQLDDYEGLNADPGERPLYKREITNAFRDGQSSEAWIYWYNNPIEGMVPIETGDVLKYLQEKNKP